MSKWTEVRDDIVKNLKVDEVTEELKQRVTKAIVDEAFPVIEEAVNKFSGKIREQAPTETGWCRIRDGIVLPLVIEALLYVAKTALTKSLTEKV